MVADFNTVTEFEKKIAEFFGAPFSVATDSCTSAIELCLRYKKADYISCPKRTYLSIPMLANKLNINLLWRDEEWSDFYSVHGSIMDAAVLWKRNSYIAGTMMCVSFQHQKHLSLNRGGIVLLDDEQAAIQLKKMSYDGRIPNTPWREQDIEIFGYHYYMPPETAALGLEKLPKAIATEPRHWIWTDWPNISEMKVFKNK